MTSNPVQHANRMVQLSAAIVQPHARVWDLTTYALIAACCAPTLWLSFLPMRELPQYAALARMLLHLHDPVYGFASFYELDFSRGASVLPLWLWGALADAVGLKLATKLMVCASLLCGQLGMCAVLRAQRKPVLLALLGLPFVYANTFYLGLVASGFSMGLGLWAMAWVLRVGEGTRARIWLAALSCALPLTHPAGLGGVLMFAACYVLAHGSSWRHKLLELWPLTPLLLGALYWAYAGLHADGVAAFHWPGLMQRVMLAPQLLIGGFNGPGEAWLLCAALVVWFYLCRPLTVRAVRESPEASACWCVAGLCLLGYLLLPSSTWSSTAICERAGSALLAWLPVLVPSAGLSAARQRGPLLLVALAIGTISFTAPQLSRFSAEASHFDAVLAKMPPRPRLWTLSYNSQGELARNHPYVHFAAYAQAERGGFLSLSWVDYAWTVPLRRRKTAPAPEPVYGAEWDPSLVQVRVDLYAFYNTVLMIGKEPREMTILMLTPFRIAAHSGMFVGYLAPPR